MRRLAFALALAWCGSVASAHAQTAASLAGDMVGQWELSTAERSKTCVVTLKKEPSGPGMKLELEKGCAEALPFTRDIAGWSIKGLDIVRLQTAKGEPVIDFTEVESGIFEGLRSGEGVYLLQNLAAARSLARSMDQMIGDWNMVRGSGRTVCGVTLTNTEAAQDTFEVYLKPPCDPQVSAFNPKTWKLERGAMLLFAPGGEVWRFEPDDNAQWRRVPDEADPLIMLRQ